MYFNKLFMCVYVYLINIYVCVWLKNTLYTFIKPTIYYIYTHIYTLIYTYISVFVEITSSLTPEWWRSRYALTSWASQQPRLSHSDCSQQRGRDSSRWSAQKKSVSIMAPKTEAFPESPWSSCQEPGNWF